MERKFFWVFELPIFDFELNPHTLARWSVLVCVWMTFDGLNILDPSESSLGLQFSLSGGKITSERAGTEEEFVMACRLGDLSILETVTKMLYAVSPE